MIHWGDVFIFLFASRPSTFLWGGPKNYFLEEVEGEVEELHDGIEAISLCVYKRAFACTGNCCRASNGPPKPSQRIKVPLNLSGDMHYDLSKPCLFRSKDQSEELAALILSYVDDMPATAGLEQECWQAMHQIATMLNY